MKNTDFHSPVAGRERAGIAAIAENIPAALLVDSLLQHSHDRVLFCSHQRPSKDNPPPHRRRLSRVGVRSQSSHCAQRSSPSRGVPHTQIVKGSVPLPALSPQQVRQAGGSVDSRITNRSQNILH